MLLNTAKSYRVPVQQNATVMVSCFSGKKMIGDARCRKRLTMVTKFGTRDGLVASWSGYDYGSKRSKVKVRGLENGWA